jgi:ATP-dependent helicase/nuclease subunit A
MTNANAALPATDPARNASVHASAGTGKTWLLVTRIVRLLLNDARADSILAVTFTRKAAGEMSQRILERLHDLMSASPAQLDALLEQSGMTPDAALRRRARALYEQLLHYPWRLRSTTFHAFCQELLQRFPIEAGVPPGFDIGESTGLLEQAARDALLADTAQRPDGPLAGDLAVLVEGCGGLYNAQAALRSFLAHRSDWWAYTQGQRDPVAYACTALAEFLHIDPQRDLLQGFANDLQQQRLASYCALLQRNDTKTSLAQAETLGLALANAESGAQLLEQITPVFFTRDGTPRAMKESAAQARRMGAENERQMLELFAQITEELTQLIDARARQRNWLIISAWYRAGSALLEHFQRIKQEQRVLDFSDLEWNACTLLNHSEHASWVQYKLDARIDHLLVDEFQDTNPTQWNLLQPLLQELAAGDPERRRSVFLVGDRKQSIYSFRRANPALLGAASDWLEQHMQAQRYTLDHSRRSASAILACVNAVFGQPPLLERLSGFTAHDTHLPDLYGHVELLPLQRADEELETATTGTHTLRNPLLAPRPESVDTHYAREGQLLADRITALVAGRTLVSRDGVTRPLQYGDIMILLRQRTHATAYENALREAGIPFQSASKGLLLENIEVRDLVALLSLLISPYDNLALAQVLRSPLFGLASEQLLPLAECSDGSYWYQRLGQLAQEARPPYDVIHALLEHWRSLSGQIPVHDLLDRIFHEGEVLPRYEAAFPPALLPRMRASLTRFIELALEIDNGRYPSLPRFLDQLQRLRQSDQDQPDEGTPDDSGGARVRLMTIHAAKGLEAPVVFLADTASRPRERSAYEALLHWPGESDRPEQFLLAGNRAKRDQAMQSLLEQQLQEHQREDANLLYVALTRARQYLFISGSSSKDNIDTTWYGMLENAVLGWSRTADGNPVCRSGVIATATPDTVRGQPALVPDPCLSQPIRIAPGNPVISPSQLDDTAQTDGHADGRERGIALHTLLDHLARDVAGEPEDMAGALAGLLGRAVDDTEFLQWWQHALHVRQHPANADLFDATQYRQACNEVPVQFLDEERMVYGVIDRVVIQDECVTLVDYKTHASATAATVSTLAGHYRNQMHYYRRAAQRLWPAQRIRCCLLFTACNERVYLDEVESPGLLSFP